MLPILLDPCAHLLLLPLVAMGYLKREANATDGGDGIAESSNKQRAVVVDAETQLSHMQVTAEAKEMVRILSGAVFITATATATLILPSVEVVKKFADSTRGKSNHGMGHPHLQAWFTFMSTLVHLTETNHAKEMEKTHFAQAIDTLKKAIAAMESDDVHLGYLHVSQCRVHINRDDKLGTIMWNLSTLMMPNDQNTLNRAIVELLRLHNAEIRMGGPPPSPAERKLKASIAAMRKKTGE